MRASQPQQHNLRAAGNADGNTQPAGGVPTAREVASAKVVPTRRGLNTVRAIYARCKVSGGCWLWQGALNDNRHPVIYAVDHARGEKRTMAGTRAMWNAAFGAVPDGAMVYRCCNEKLCLNPRHLRIARSKREMFAAFKGSPKLKRDRAQVLAAAHKGHAAQGQPVTPIEVIRAIKAAPPKAVISNAELARRLGTSHWVVSSVRLGKSHREVTP